MSMSTKMRDAERLVEANPKVDRVQVEEALRLMRELRQAGHQSNGYSLAPPYSRERRQSTEKDRARSDVRRRGW